MWVLALQRYYEVHKVCLCTIRETKKYNNNNFNVVKQIYFIGFTFYILLNNWKKNYLIYYI